MGNIEYQMKIKLVSYKFPNLSMRIDRKDYKVLAKHIWRPSPTKIGGFYATTRIKKDGEYKTVYAHRMIMDQPKGMVVDHINHNTLDNRRNNLRVCTQSQNAFNRGIQRQNTSGYKGVHYYRKKKKYCAYIDISRKRIHLGYFESAIEAAKKYNETALFFRGEYAYINNV